MDIESIMELVCDNCHWPYVCDEDEMEERCAGCKIEQEIRKLMVENAPNGSIMATD